MHKRYVHIPRCWGGRGDFAVMMCWIFFFLNAPLVLENVRDISIGLPFFPTLRFSWSRKRCRQFNSWAHLSRYMCEIKLRVNLLCCTVTLQGSFSFSLRLEYNVMNEFFGFHYSLIFRAQSGTGSAIVPS